MALTRGMQRVAVTHVSYRGSFARPSPFIEDIPAVNRVAGWLRTPMEQSAPDALALRQMAALEEASRWQDP